MIRFPYRTRGVARALGLVVIVGMVALVSLSVPGQTAPGKGTFAVVSVEASGAKIWLPSTIVVHAGQQVTLKLDNKLDAPHGFAIDDYAIQAVVPAGATQEVKFTAKRGVTSRFYCQIHPAHVGGQILVVP
jgi:nitrosocyanin